MIGQLQLLNGETLAGVEAVRGQLEKHPIVWTLSAPHGDQRDLTKAQVHDFIDKSLLEVERLDDMVENMLLASKIDNRSYTFPKANFNLSVLVDSIVNRLQITKCEGTQQIIDAEIESKIEITGDKFALTSVVTNLIENAIKYSGPCETVDVKLFSRDEKVYLEVADHGEA